MTDGSRERRGRLEAALADRYAIERELGEGGMATVHLAHDLKHDRPVALKVLKPELSALVGAERFLAEIRTTANLQHPHILPLFDSGEADGFLFYVMPYVEGETLRERLDREKQLPVDEGVRIAAAVASALDYAHRQGVIHRDIKPGNILLQDGEPVVADFGIAIAVGAAGGSRLTETGLSVGTPYYMSPEQATGDQQVGPASDTYSLACVLYEMLVGEPPYLGNTAQAVLGKIIQGTPVSATAVRRSIPTHVDAAIRRALERLPADRFTSAHEFGKALTDPSFRHGAGPAATGEDALRWKRVATGLGAALVVTVVGLGWAAFAPEAVPAAPVRRFAAPFRGDQVPQTNPSAPSFALSPDGSVLVYRAQTDQGLALMARRWDDLDASVVRGTDLGYSPSVSPDGTEVAFWQPPGRVLVVPLAGGPARELLEWPYPLPYWAPDGYIYLSSLLGLGRVPQGGGAVDTLTRVAEGEAVHVVSDVVDGAALFTVGYEDSDAVFEMRALELDTRETTAIGPGGLPRFLDGGYLVYLAPDSALVAAPFDLRTRTLTGAGVSMIGSVNWFTMSRDGDLFYQTTGLLPPTTREFVWVSRSGQATPVQPGWTFDQGDANTGWSLSPDGTRLAYRELRDGNYDIWIKQLDQGPLSRLTFDPSEERMPRWARDGETVTFLSRRGGVGFHLYAKAADGTGEVSLVSDALNLSQGFWSPDGEWLVFRSLGVGNVEGGRDILAMRPAVDSAAVPLLMGEYDEVAPALSPDGRWLAYGSNETGRYEVFVRPFPDVNAGRWQVSTNGGLSPLWAHSGRELFFMDGENRMVAAQVEAGAAIRVGELVPLFDIPVDYVGRAGFITGIYDVSPDDTRFLMAREVTGQAEEVRPEDRWILVQNWAEEVRARVGR